MARIIYGLLGEGMGHAIRSSILLKHLIKKHKVKIFAGGRAYKFMAQKFKDVNEIESLNIAYKNNRVAKFSTIMLNVKKTKLIRESYSKVKNSIKEFKADIVMSDHEPITHWAAVFSGYRNIVFSNQEDVTFKKAKPKISELMGFLDTRIITLLFNSWSNLHVTYTINPSNDSSKRIYVGNLTREEIIKQKPKYGKHIFVYQTSESNELLLKILEEIDEKFIVYGFNKNKKEKNIIFRKFNDNIFYKDLCESKAVIVNGGFTTIAEAVYLKKPILSIPIEGQYEQIFNANIVEKMGFGMHLDKAEKNKMIEFLQNLQEYCLNLEKYKSMPNEEIFEKIDKAIFSN